MTLLDWSKEVEKDLLTVKPDGNLGDHEEGRQQGGPDARRGGKPARRPGESRLRPEGPGRGGRHIRGFAGGR